MIQSIEMELHPTIGSIVHYVLPDGPGWGNHRPAIVVHRWSNAPDAALQLQVFTDSGERRDSNDQLPPVMWATSVKEDPEGEKPGTWHWPELPELEGGEE